MRRFINTIPGRLVANVSALGLLLPFLSLLVPAPAAAQFQQLPTWAVVDFVNKSKTGGAEVGSAAAGAVGNELLKSGKYDIVPQETVQRAVESLGLRQPVTDKPSLQRLGGELRAATLVTGEVVNYRIVSESGGKRADVLLRMVVLDVSSALPINGAAIGASSSTRAGAVDDTTLLNEALAAAAAQATREINQRNLPTATVLNTLTNEALINQGTRTGFQAGMELIVVRGAEQVATATVDTVEFDSAVVRITKSFRGIQPGDKVRAIFDPPILKPDWNANNGNPQIVKPKTRKSNSQFTTLAIVGGIMAILLSNSSTAESVSVFNAEAMLYPNFSGVPAVQLSWKLDLFHRGRSTMYSWQLFRNDVLTSPVTVVLGDATKAWDTTGPRDVAFSTFGGQIGGNTCDNAAPEDETATGVAGVIAGRPYTYQIQQLYRVAGIDLPGGGTTGGGTTGGGTGGGTAGTTGGTAGTTGGTGGTTGGTGGTAEFCYFLSPKQMAKGIATPLDRVLQVSPTSGATVATDDNFTFTSVATGAFPIVVEYALQFSTDESFTNKNLIKTYAKIIRTEIGILAFVPVDYRRNTSDTLLNRLRSDFGSSTLQVFWRVGGRNTSDLPGPVADKAGNRYVFGPPRRMLLPTLPPPPP